MWITRDSHVIDNFLLQEIDDRYSFCRSSNISSVRGATVCVNDYGDQEEEA